MLRSRRAAFVLAVAAVAVAGCGSSNKTSGTGTGGITNNFTSPPGTAAAPSTTTAASVATFTAQLKSVCDQYQAATKRLGDAATAAALQSKWIATFKAVAPPAPLAADYSKLLAALNTYVAVLQTHNTSAEANAVARELAVSQQQLSVPRCISG